MQWFKIVLFLFFVGLFTHSCGKQFFIRNKEARDDAKAYEMAVNAQSKISHALTAVAETKPVAQVEPDDDAADDPAFWYNENDPSKTLVFGSNKKAGIHSYNLQGEEIQFVPCGKINNVDVRKGIRSKNDVIDVVAGSNRTDNSISLFVIGENGRIHGDQEFKIALGIFEPYGFCLAKTPNNELHAFVNNKEGDIYQIGIQIEGNNLTSGIIRRLKVDTQPEGMIVDDEAQVLYVGEEQKGIHYVSSKASASTRMKTLKQSTADNPAIHFDIEGLSLFEKSGKKYLLASIQGSFSYAIFDLEKNKYLTSFVIKSDVFDGVEETDGLDILQKNLGGPFEEGILAVQDGFNQEGEGMVAQNFKYVALGELLALVP
jgi:3-phytase